MFNKSEPSRLLARRYLELARIAENTDKREELLGYASVYEQHLSDSVEQRRRKMKINNIMSRDVQYVSPDTTLLEAASLMKKIDAGCLPVAERDKLVGMITDRDIAVRGMAEGKGPGAKVRDAMSHEVKYCFEDEEVSHIAENMAELQIRRLPVMTRQKRLVGIVALADLTKGSLPHTAKALHGISKTGGHHNQSHHA